MLDVLEQELQLPVGQDTSRGTRALQDRANDQAILLRPIIARLQSEGVTSTSALMNALNEAGIPSSRGGSWNSASLRNLLTRLSKIPADH